MKYEKGVDDDDDEEGSEEGCADKREYCVYGTRF